MQPELYELHNELEYTHWWFTARSRIVMSQLQREMIGDETLQRPLRILDAGCGAGGMLARLGAFGSAVGVDPSPVAVGYARKKGLDARIGGLPDSLPFAPPDSFDVITLLDVLEHVDDDAAALRSLHELLAPGGRLILTVPAFPSLWSGHDVANEHRRRYRLHPLKRLLTDTGFDVLRISYCNTALFPAVALWRGARRLVSPRSLLPDHASPDIRPVPRLLNATLYHLFAAERHIIGRAPLPFGVSLLAVVRPALAHSSSR